MEKLRQPAVQKFRNVAANAVNFFLTVKVCHSFSRPSLRCLRSTQISSTTVKIQKENANLFENHLI